MMTELCAELRNYFILEPDENILEGEFTISGGTITPLSLQDGQFFRIVGSVFNEGVWQFKSGKTISGMTNETFSGTVWLMSVPPAVRALADDISAWLAENKAAVESPYQSESFAGYAYTLKSGNASNGSDGVSASSWQSVFAARLSPYRRKAARV